MSREPTISHIGGYGGTVWYTIGATNAITNEQLIGHTGNHCSQLGANIAAGAGDDGGEAADTVLGTRESAATGVAAEGACICVHICSYLKDNLKHSQEKIAPPPN